MSSKREFLERIKYLESAIALEELIDQGIAPSEHNGRANLLRKGVGIIGFNILEDYIKSRTVEALGAISSLNISFNRLPKELIQAASLGALEALFARATIIKKTNGDWLGLIQEEARKIHSTANPSYELSSVSLASSGSNVSQADVQEILRSFDIGGGWATLKKISDKIGGGIPDLAQAYRNLADRRHSAAHSAIFQFDYAWLKSMIREIFAISASFDIALAARLRMASATSATGLGNPSIESHLGYIFLEDAGEGVYRQTKSLGGRSHKNWRNLDSAVGLLLPVLPTRNSFLIEIGSDRRISGWHT